MDVRGGNSPPVPPPLPTYDWRGLEMFSRSDTPSDTDGNFLFLSSFGCFRKIQFRYLVGPLPGSWYGAEQENEASALIGILF